MSTVMETSPAVAQAKMITTMCRDRLLKTFGFVPDDKLTWAPVEGCKSALRIAAHCGVANHNFIRIIQRIPFPEDLSEMFAESRRKEESITTREEAVALIESSTQAVLEALDALTAEEIASDVPTPFFTAPMPFFMNLPGRHMDNHASQIDLLQTCWGDMDWHF